MVIESAFWPNVVIVLCCITFWITQALEDKWGTYDQSSFTISHWQVLWRPN